MTAQSQHRFNPRPRMGRLRDVSKGLDCFIVSIHAPVWGDHQFRRSSGRPQRFNPRPRMGATHVDTILFLCHDCFNPRPVWGRRVWPLTALGYPCFNPRPRMGATKVCDHERAEYLVSIHAPVWGHDPSDRVLRQDVLFQSTPPYGGDAIVVACRVIAPAVSIHAPVWGRRKGHPDILAHYQFQSTPPYGGDTLRCPSRRRPGPFQSTPPYGGDGSSSGSSWAM